MSKRTKRKGRAPEALQADLAVTVQPKAEAPAGAQEERPGYRFPGILTSDGGLMVPPPKVRYVDGVELGRCEVTGRTKVVRSTVTLGRLTIR